MWWSGWISQTVPTYIDFLQSRLMQLSRLVFNTSQYKVDLWLEGRPFKRKSHTNTTPSCYDPKDDVTNRQYHVWHDIGLKVDLLPKVDLQKTTRLMVISRLSIPISADPMWWSGWISQTVPTYIDCLQSRLMQLRRLILNTSQYKVDLWFTTSSCIL